MKSSRVLLLFLVLFLSLGWGCGGGGGGGDSSSSGASSNTETLPNGTTLPVVEGDNVLTVTVNGSQCSAASLSVWPNKPCVTVTICDTDNTRCQTVNDILLDTGDFGLRLFQQAVTEPDLLDALTQVEVGSLPLYECVQYGDGTTVWGPVKRAHVMLGNERTVAPIPIHLIGSSTADLLGDATHACADSSADPDSALYNGSLGLGIFAQDCGSTCTLYSDNGQYYTCNGVTCTPVAVSLSDQVQNPIASLSGDNNGAALMFPSVPSEGASSVNGYVVLGIGTRSNNTPSAVVAYGANQSGNFTTVYKGVSYPSFLDSGSNGLFFPDTGISTCSGWFCPASKLSLIATNKGASGSPSDKVHFQITSLSSFAASSNVLSTIGAYQPGMFDWGFPFFLGRNVYIGLEGASSSLGSGPYWAY